jgi:hypothetical protein
MKIDIISTEPFTFVQINHKGNAYWAIEFARQVTERLPVFSRYVICAPIFTVDQLLFIQRQAIERGESEDIRHWIYQALEERQRFVRENRMRFFWAKEGGLEVISYPDIEDDKEAKRITAENCTLAELGELTGIAIQQGEDELMIDFLRQVAAQYVESYHRPTF